MVGEADDCAGCVVLIDEVTLRLIHSRCASLANQSAGSITGTNDGDVFSGEPGRSSPAPSFDVLLINRRGAFPGLLVFVQAMKQLRDFG